jgi:rhodanese-related sulfurtransferase
MSQSSPPVEPVTRDEVKQGLADGSIALVDVREAHEFAAGHIPGSISMPLSTFDAAALPRDKKVVFSCNSGRRTLMAMEKAQDAGRPELASHYEGSFQDWLMAGEPIER